MELTHRERWARYLRQPSEQKSIAPVLGLTVLAMLSTPLLNSYHWGRALEIAVVGASAVIALTRTGAHGGFRHTAEAIVVATTLGAAVASGVGNASEARLVQSIAAGLFVLLLLITPIVILLRLLLRPKITVDTLAGALAAYLQIGIFFGALYRFVDLVGDAQFFVQTTSPGPMDFQYFSFITMTTVGYGDLTPATSWGQTLATIEAVTGQVFLVTVVALTVSNLGRELPHRREVEVRLEEADDGPADGPADTTGPAEGDQADR